MTRSPGQMQAPQQEEAAQRHIMGMKGPHAEAEEEEEKLVRAWEGPMEQAAASLLGARQMVGGFEWCNIRTLVFKYVRCGA